MGAYFRRLLEEADGDLVARRLFELLEADRGGGPAGPPPTMTTSYSMLSRSIGSSSLVERWRAAAGVHRRAIVLRAVDKLRRRVASPRARGGSSWPTAWLCCATDCVL